MYTITFPSPSRGSYFSMRKSNVNDKQAFQVSVPFPGILFLNWIIGKPKYGFCYRFRPLPGDLISQYECKGAQRRTYGGFRPLPGDLISQSCPLHA